jgi:hypothetical protein
VLYALIKTIVVLDASLEEGDIGYHGRIKASVSHSLALTRTSKKVYSASKDRTDAAQ